MTDPQTKLYWREWGAVRRAKPDADRHLFHVAALGHDKSSKDFNNEDLDKVLAAFRRVSDPDNLNVQLRQIDQPKLRLLYRIRQLAEPPYIAVLLRERFANQQLEDLSVRELTQLRNTLAARAGARKRKAREAELVEANEPF